MYIFRVNTDLAIVELAVEDMQVRTVANFLENANNVIGFTVSAYPKVFTQKDFGVGDFKKWKV